MIKVGQFKVSKSSEARLAAGLFISRSLAYIQIQIAAALAQNSPNIIGSGGVLSTRGQSAFPPVNPGSRSGLPLALGENG